MGTGNAVNVRREKYMCKTWGWIRIRIGILTESDQETDRHQNKYFGFGFNEYESRSGHFTESGS
jgi:hypothetical protein